MTLIEMLAEQNRTTNDLSDRAIAECYFDYYLQKYPKDLDQLFQLSCSCSVDDYGTERDPYLLILNILFDVDCARDKWQEQLFALMAAEHTDRVGKLLEAAKSRLEEAA